MGVVSQKFLSRKKNPPFQNPRSAPALDASDRHTHTDSTDCYNPLRMRAEGLLAIKLYFHFNFSRYLESRIVSLYIYS